MTRKLLRGFIPLILLALAGCDGTGGAGYVTGGASLTEQEPSILTTELSRAERGSPYHEQLSATTPPDTGPVAWALAPESDPLPSGIALSADGLLSGTPDQSSLSVLVLEASNSTGRASTVSLDFVVNEAVGYSHSPDAYDLAGNDDHAGATWLGSVSMGASLVEGEPLSLSSDPSHPFHDPVDFYSFTTPARGEIEIEVFFARSVGKLFASIHGDHKGEPEEFIAGAPGPGGDDQIVTLPDAPAGTWFLKVEAQYKNGTANENAYTFRVRYRDLTVTSALVEHDTVAGAVHHALQATRAGAAVADGEWSLASGSLPGGVTLYPDGTLSGTPAESGLFQFSVEVEADGATARREVELRVYNSSQGDYWRRDGERRYFDATRTDGDGPAHEHYCEAMVVAPHPDYGPEGAIYVIGGRVDETVSDVYVFHTAHQADADREFKLEEIGAPLTSERQYLGGAFLQHTYGGYIYVVGGELYSNTAPSSGAYTRAVERMQVSDGAGNALASPGAWESLAELPDDDAGRHIEGWAEFGLVAADAAVDGDDRLYLVGGRMRVENTPGSGIYVGDYNDKVLMFEAPLTAAGTGAWHEKSDAGAYTPRRFPAVGMIGGRIYILGGNAPSGTADYVEMYEPDPSGVNPAFSTAGASSFPTLSEPVWYAASAVHNGSLYVLNGWTMGAYSPVATSRLQKFTPSGSGGSMDELTAPDVASGYHDAVFHDGGLWFLTGRDSFSPTPKYSLRYEP